MPTSVKKDDPEYMWQIALTDLSHQMEKETFNQWLSNTSLIKYHDDRWQIGVRSDRAKEWLDTSLKPTISRTLESIAGQKIQLEFVVIEQQSHQNGVFKPGGYVDDQTAVDKRKKKQKHSSGDAPIEYRNIRRPTDPLRGHVAVPHYVIRFYPLVIGREAFLLWQLISSYAYEFQELGKTPPSLKKLNRKMGYSKTDITALTGRKNRGRKGLLDILREHHICKHESVGHGRGQRQIFDYLTLIQDAPLLTPRQVATLDPDDQTEHEEWLLLHMSDDYTEWEKDDRESRIPVFPDGEIP